MNKLIVHVYRIKGKITKVEKQKYGLIFIVNEIQPLI